MEDALIDAITCKIASKFKYPIHVDDLGQDFARPAFHVYRISDLDTPLNRWTYNTNTIIQIMYFSAVDEYENIISTADQTGTINTLKNMFLMDMGVKYGSKWARLSKSNVDYTGDKDIFLQLTLDSVHSTREEYDNTNNSNVQTMNEFNFEGGAK